LFYLEKPIWDFEVRQNGRKVQNGKFCSQNFNFQPVSKNLTAFEASFLKNFFSKIQNSGFFEDDVIFEKKSTFFNRVVPTLNSTLFKSSKSNSVVKILKIYQKILPKKISKDGGDMQDGVWSFFLYKICLVTVILGL
jgi:hypothetical protein